MIGLHLVIAHFKKLTEQNFFYQRCLYNNALSLKYQNWNIFEDQAYKKLMDFILRAKFMTLELESKSLKEVKYNNIIERINSNLIYYMPKQS